MKIKFLRAALEKYKKNITEQHSTIQLIEQHLVESRNEKHESLDEFEDRNNSTNKLKQEMNCLVKKAFYNFLINLRALLIKINLCRIYFTP